MSVHEAAREIGAVVKVLFVAALVVGMFLIALIRVPDHTTDQPAPRIEIIPNATPTTSPRPLLGVPCTDRDGYRYRAAFCPGTP